jgi:hypothetical protein
LPDRYWFPSIAGRTFKNALPARKTVSAGENEEARSVRRISWVTMAGWAYLLGSIFLKCVFGVFPEQGIFHGEMEVDGLRGGGLHKNFST